METGKNERYRAVALLVLTAILWSLGGILIKIVSWHPLAIAGMRSFFASLVFLFYLGKPKFTWSPWQIIGAFSYLGVVALIVVATKLTSAANAILLHYTAPVYIALLSPLVLKEPVKFADWLTIGLVFMGMGLFFFDELALANIWGNIFAALSGLCFAILIISLNKQKEASPFESVFLGNILTTIIGLPFILFSTSWPNLNGFLAMACLGIFQLGLPYIIYILAIRKVTALDSILIPILEPILNPLWVFFFLGEKPGPWALLGGLIVLAAVVFRSLHKIKGKNVSNENI